MVDCIYSNKRKNISFLDLDDDILLTIFTKLSITTILGCKTVCKSLYLFLSSRYFAESYQSNPPFKCFINHTGDSFSLIELYSGRYNYLLKTLPDPFGLSYCGLDTRSLVGSCNGFFCFCDKDLLYVSNPLSGTHVRLPDVVLDGVVRSSYGFGYCPQTQHYKVIQLASYVRPFSRTEVNVFTVGVDKFWRRVHSPFQRIQLQRVIFDNHPIIRFLEVNGKGVLLWVVDDPNWIIDYKYTFDLLVDGPKRLDYLYSFDILEEKVVPVPTPVGLEKRNATPSILLLPVDGCVCLLHMNQFAERIEFWCMTDYMVQGSWTLRIVSQISVPEFFWVFWKSSQFHPVTVWTNEKILTIHQDGLTISCDLEQNTFRKPYIPIPRCLDRSAVCFVPNFFSNLETGTTEVQNGGARITGNISSRVSLECQQQFRNKIPFLSENILSRVVVDTFLSCKNVWCNFLSNPPFEKTYDPVHLILCDKASPRFLFQLKSDLSNNVKACPLLDTAPPPMSKITVLGSCNGLVCLSVGVHQMHDVYICNPIVEEFAILPQPKGVKQIRDEAYGFGFSSMTGHYKVLRILKRKRRPEQYEAYVLTIGIDKNWRQVAVGSGSSTFFRLPKEWPEDINKARFCDVPFNNAIHWVAKGDSRIMMIYAFDIDKEQISLLSPIPGMDNHMYNRSYYPCLGVFKGCLCVCVIHPQLRDAVELWSMRSYGSLASWTRETISIAYKGPKPYVVIPLMSWRDEEEILMWVGEGGGTLISYCSREKRRTDTKINKGLIAVPYVPSFLPLNDAFRNGSLEVSKMIVIQTALQRWLINPLCKWNTI